MKFRLFESSCVMGGESSHFYFNKINVFVCYLSCVFVK
jgi:hypothetical protein